MNRARIKEIFLANGFKEKLQERGMLSGLYDLNPYVYTAAEALLQAFVAEVQEGISSYVITDDDACDPDRDEAFNDGLETAEGAVLKALRGEDCRYGASQVVGTPEPSGVSFYADALGTPFDERVVTFSQAAYEMSRTGPRLAGYISLDDAIALRDSATTEAFHGLSVEGGPYTVPVYFGAKTGGFDPEDRGPVEELCPVQATAIEIDFDKAREK